MHRSRLAQLVIDCRQPELDAAAGFWSGALGQPWRRLPDPDDGHYRQLDTAPGQPGILLQAVRHPSRVHLDIESTDVEAEVRRLEALGARRVTQVRDWWVMQAPTGHRFCVLRQQRDDLPKEGHRWP
ncbi:VOC family protein [Pseudoxanthomonas japonensis]|nr:VOC family protein [Pseudoxanthomonas japonensis]